MKGVEEFWGRVLKAVNGDRKNFTRAAKWLLDAFDKIGEEEVFNWADDVGIKLLSKYGLDRGFDYESSLG